MIITLSEAKEYLRIDGEDEDEVLESMLNAAESLCRDIARIDEQAFEGAGDIAKTAVLYTLAYFYEHRDEADHHALTVSLRNLLMGIRNEGF